MTRVQTKNDFFERPKYLILFEKTTRDIMLSWLPGNKKKCMDLIPICMNYT